MTLFIKTKYYRPYFLEKSFNVYLLYLSYFKILTHMETFSCTFQKEKCNLRERERVRERESIHVQVSCTYFDFKVMLRKSRILK